MASESSAETVTIRFRSSLPTLKTSLPESPFTVPITLGRYGLSELVNHIIGADQTHRGPFDFAIGKRLVRKALTDIEAVTQSA